MPDALATLFEDACPRARHISIDADDWRVDLSEQSALHVVVPLHGGGWVTGPSGADRAVAAGDVVVATAPVQMHGDAAQPRPHHLLVGTYDVGGSVCERALTGLPEVIVAGSSGHLSVLTEMLANESQEMRAGHDAIVIRVLDLLP